jgi:hypothetical protein
VPAHCTIPGVHTPLHPVSVHSVAHRDEASHVPVAEQVDSIPVSHFFVPGLQFPVHAPLVQRYGHIASLCHVPLALQTRSSDPKHSFAPDMHGIPTPASPSIDASGLPPPAPTSGPGPDPASTTV